jgi:hypothetical protein
MADARKLPPVWLPMLGDELSLSGFFAEESQEVERTDPGFLREADARIAQLDVAKYEPAVGRCKTCKHFETNRHPSSDVYVIAPPDMTLCAAHYRATLTRRDGSGFCWKHEPKDPATTAPGET